MTIFLTLREARGNTILWEYRGPSVPVYVMAGSVVPLMIYYALAQEYIQLQLYKSDKTRISQLLASGPLHIRRSDATCTCI
jgi:hypothetical protein